MSCEKLWIKQCIICGDVEQQPTSGNVPVNEDTIRIAETLCDVCEMEAVAEVEALGVPTDNIKGDLAITREMI